MSREGSIDIVGADANNLRNVSVSIPVNALTAVVGVSGSGKSSLLDKTLGLEAARRVRRFLDVDIGATTGQVRAFVGKLPPAILVGQRPFHASSRSTIGTATPVLRLLRKLFLQFGQLYADDIGELIPEPTPEGFAHWLSRHASGRARIWAVPLFQKATNGNEVVRRLAAAGVTEFTVFSETDRGKKLETGTLMSVSRFKPLNVNVRHTVEASIGQLLLSSRSHDELLILLKKAWAAGNGAVFVELLDCDRLDLKREFSYGLDTRTHRVHPDSPQVFCAPTTHLLSFNAPQQENTGACPVCNGLGKVATLNVDELVKFPGKSMHEGAFALWTPKNYKHVSIQHSTIEGLRGRGGFDPDMPWSQLAESAQRIILEGIAEPVVDVDPTTKKKSSAPHSYEGFRNAIIERFSRGTTAGEALRPFVSSCVCNACAGSRWSLKARAVKVGGMSIDQILAMPFLDLQLLMMDNIIGDKLAGSISAEGRQRARVLTLNIARLSEGFVSVGLGHLSGDRSMLEVSDGESRRIQLASVLNSRLAGMLLMLDEPGRGLHEQDLASLAESICQAAARHTVVMSEHRYRLIRQADYLIELGPGAGSAGGAVIKTHDIATNPQNAPELSPNRIVKTGREWLEIRGARVNSVSNVNAAIPLGTLTCIAGVSGSGKSSFVRGIVVPALSKILPRENVEIDDFRTLRGTWAKVDGAAKISALHALDQAPVTTQPRSLIATFLNVASAIRKDFAETARARALKLASSDFGTNAGRGRCQACLGLGVADDGEPCSVCGGSRFCIEVLSVRFNGINIAELLALPISTLANQMPEIIGYNLAKNLVGLGIGHLSLGRSLNTLSGGEAQRLRIARALSQHHQSGAFFVIDEPACGLHPDDVDQLYRALRHIVADGNNTVLLVEHEPSILARSDYLIEFGPESGPRGGEVIAAGTPLAVSRLDTPTGRSLRSSSPPRDQNRRKAQRPELQTSANLAEGAKMEIRQLLGHDVIAPDLEELVFPAAVFSNTFNKRRAHELADLDQVIAAIALDAHQKSKDSEAFFLTRWQQNPEARLYLNPFLEALSIWGPELPLSVIRRVEADARAVGLERIGKVSKSICAARMTGERLRPIDNSCASLTTALSDAVLLGNGYVELLSTSGTLIASFGDRLFDFDSGIVGPRRANPAHFSRSEAMGKCACCNGRGFVESLDEQFLINNKRSNVFDESLVTDRALALLRGGRRSTMIPFFNRMVDEGLWNDVPWARMTSAQRFILLHGFWVRSGHGTFVKNGKNFDGSEVNHWLVWDGLVPMFIEQLSRSKDEFWIKSVKASFAAVVCYFCKGSGLNRNASLLKLGGISLQDLTLKGTVGELLSAMRAFPDLPARAHLERDRVLACLSPVSESLTLREVPGSAVQRKVLTCAAHEFIGLPAVFL